MATAFEAFKIGLKKDSPFYEDLVMTPCKRMEEVRSRTLKPYSKPYHHRVNAIKYE